MELNLDLFGATDQIHGVISDGAWTAVLEGDRAVRSLSNAVPQPGRYTILFAGSEDAANLPGGYGFGLAKLSSSGQLKLMATLGDGTHAIQTTAVSKAGRCPFYAILYGGRGAVLGWVTFDTARTAGFQGNALWFKPPSAEEQFYPAGFAVQASVSGALYRPPTAGERLLNWTNGLVVLAGGNLNSPLTNQVMLEADNTITVASNDEQLKITIALPTGSVSGSFVHPFTRQPVHLQGTVQGGLGIIGGLFSGTNQTGSLLIAPAPSL